MKSTNAHANASRSILRLFMVSVLFAMGFFTAQTASAQTSAVSKCNLSNSSCSPTTFVTGVVSVTSDSGDDILLDGSYVGNTSYSWNTAGVSAGQHTLQECYTQSTSTLTCQNVWVPNWVWVSDMVYVDDWVCDAYDADGNCTDYVDDGYWEDDGSYQDEGSYQEQCTPTTGSQYICQNQITVTVETPAQVNALLPQVFDPNFYLQTYGDLRAAFGTNTTAATQHWLNYGMNEGRQGSLTFSASQYINMYGDLKAAFGPTGYAAAIQHYANYGISEGRAGLYVLRGEVFNATWYLQHYGDLQAAFGTNTTLATQHWINYGMHEGRQGALNFSAVQYLAMYSDLTAAFGATGYPTALQHFITNGMGEGRVGLYALRGEVFNATWYLQHYGDLQAAFGTNTSAATQHWLTYGVNEGRQASASFSSRDYLARYGDLRAAFGSTGYAAAIQHYIIYGLKEGRNGQ